MINQMGIISMVAANKIFRVNLTGDTLGNFFISTKLSAQLAAANKMASSGKISSNHPVPACGLIKMTMPIKPTIILKISTQIQFSIFD